MLKTKFLICIAAWMAVTSAGAQIVTGNARYVDPFIGVDGGGNVFPGVCTPFGMVKLGPIVAIKIGMPDGIPTAIYTVSAIPM